MEVDIKLGKIKILHIINVHDSGKLINPKLAEMQVQGGMSMGMGYVCRSSSFWMRKQEDH